MKIATWTPNQEKQVFTGNSKVLRVGDMDFTIWKPSYGSQMHSHLQYLNYFSEFYDVDSEVVEAYATIKGEIDGNFCSVYQFRRLVYNIFKSDTMIKKIDKMVDDNLVEDPRPTPRGMVRPFDMRSLMTTSMYFRIIFPLILQYIHHYEKRKDVEAIQYMCRPYFDIHESELYHDLKSLVEYRVQRNYSKNKAYYDSVGEYDTGSSAQKILDSLVVDVIPKVRFDMDAYRFIDVVIERQIAYQMSSIKKYNDRVNK